MNYDDAKTNVVEAETESSQLFGWDVARAQKGLLLAVLLELASVVPQLGWPLYVAGVVLSYWSVYTMGDALKAHESGLSVGGGSKWLILLWLPYIGFVALLILNQKATRFLKAAGYSVGLFGARKPR